MTETVTQPPTIADSQPHPALGVTDLLLFIMAVIWGINFVVVKYATRIFPPVAFTGLRVGTAALFLIVFALMRRAPADETGARASGKSALASLPRSDVIRLLMLGLLGNAIPRVELVGAATVPAAFDYHIPLMSVPLALGLTVASVPAPVPYLKAEPERVARWQSRIGENGFKIGISWQGARGGVTSRAIPLRCFEGLSKISGVRLISLQKGFGAEQLSDTCGVESLGDEFDAGPNAFLDSSAVMQNLDLVITLDSALAHLAGALGRPVWVALKRVPDWRWLLGRDDSPWYPSMKLFRQKTEGDWAGVFAEMQSQVRP